MKKFNYVSDLPELKQLETEEIKGKRYYITPSGKKLPSITTILGHSKRNAMAEWRARVGEEEANKVSRQASGRGTRFHSMMEKYLCNEPIDKILHENIMPDIKVAFKKFMSFANRIDNIHYIESPLYSEELFVAGRTDCIAEFDGTLSIIDFKTSKQHKREEHIQDYFQQGAAYALMYEELVGQHIDQVVIMISPNDGDIPQIFVRQKDEYIEPLLEKIKDFHKEFSNTVYRRSKSPRSRYRRV